MSLPCFLPPAPTLRTLDMSAAKLSDAERLMFCALQGIINRTRPRILLYNHNEEPQSTWPTAHSLRATPVSVAAPYTLMKQFKEEIRGLVLYSTEKSDHYMNLAVTIAGLERLLPVTADVKAKLEKNGLNFPVIEDITDLTMTTATSIYNHLYNNYWSRCNHRLLSIDFSHTHRPTAGECELFVVQCLVATIASTFDATTYTYMKHPATLGIRMIYQTSQGTYSLIACLVGGLLHGIGLNHQAKRSQQRVVGMFEHQTRHAVIIKHSVALWLFHRFLERRAGTTLIAVLVDKIASTHKVLLIKVILYPHIFHVHLTIGIAHVNLSLPLAVGEAHAHTHVRDTNTTFQLVLLML